MSKTKVEKIIKIAECTGSSKIEVWTTSFKVEGTLLTDEDKIAKGIVSIINPIIHPLLGNEVESELKYEWLNIFEDEIIAFTIVK